MLRVKGCQLSGLGFYSEAVEEVAAGTEKRRTRAARRPLPRGVS